FGGAAGTLEKLGDNAATVRADVAKRLGLADRQQWQSQRDGIAEFGN
ncbi:3-carboxy-cis,cis-muconate cycloisomerase, partial [Rhizobium sp. BR5]